MSKFRVQNITIGSLGVLKVNIPTLIFGKGKPRVLIMTAQHGGERSGLLVIARLIQLLKLRRGTCIVVPIANPLGVVLRTRDEPIERMDLNRSYPGNLSKDFSRRITNKIFEIAEKSDCILDLHTFTRRNTNILGVVTRGIKPVTAKTSRLLRALRPDAVWEINYTRTGAGGFLGDIDSALLRKGIPVVGLELPMEEKITDGQIESVAWGIINLLSEFNMVSTPLRKSKSKKIRIPVYASEYLYANDSGIFVPEKNIFEQVKKGDSVGYLQVLPDFRSRVVRSPNNGKILSLYMRGFVRTGEKLASIGRRIRVL